MTARGRTFRLRGAAGRPAGHPRDRGSGAVWVFAVGMVVVLAAAAVVLQGAAAVARHQAETAADFAALAAALDGLRGAADPCARAEEVAVANDARVVTCRLAGDSAEVEVARRLPGALLHRWQARGWARAGPDP